MDETITLTLNSPITEEQWDVITDVDFDRTDRMLFYTKHGKEVEFIKVIRCRDCKYCRTYYHGYNMPFSYACDRMYLTNGLSLDDYCSRAERKEA